MTLQEIKQEIQKYQYFEDTNIIDVALASIVATRLKLGDPIWLVIIGASSGGKSQILRPLSLTDTKFLHRIDDLTENTFLSGGSHGKAESKKEVSLLNRIGPLGMLVISDLTVLFSKNKESRGAILSQFRMIYDGEMTKFVGTSDKPLVWKGHLSVLAGSTPSIYAHFEEVSDMGERFIYYRMKPYDAEKATRLALNRKSIGKETDRILSELYGEYIEKTIKQNIGKEVVLSAESNNRIIEIAMFAEKVRTVSHTDFFKKIDRIPVPAMPMRVALQLTTIAKGLMIMRGGELTSNDLDIVDWCGYSLANEEKRACLKVLAGIPFTAWMKTSTLSSKIGLSTDITQVIINNIAATGIVKKGEISGNSLQWKISEEKHHSLVRRVEKIEGYPELYVYENSKEVIELNRESVNASFEDVLTSEK